MDKRVVSSCKDTIPHYMNVLFRNFLYEEVTDKTLYIYIIIDIYICIYNYIPVYIYIYIYI